jgi:hypothetical protein
MSAYLVSADDINVIVTAYRDLVTATAPISAPILDWTAMGRRLWLENLASVAYRYNMPARHADEYAAYLLDVSGYEFAEFKAKPEAIAKIARCYRYQSCEHDGWEASNAKTIVDIVEERYGEDLPGYGAMPWGIGSDADAARARA